jgi:hypothetical protein
MLYVYSTELLTASVNKLQINLRSGSVFWKKLDMLQNFSFLLSVDAGKHLREISAIMPRSFHVAQYKVCCSKNMFILGCYAFCTVGSIYCRWRGQVFHFIFQSVSIMTWTSWQGPRGRRGRPKRMQSHFFLWAYWYEVLICSVIF